MTLNRLIGGGGGWGLVCENEAMLGGGGDDQSASSIDHLRLHIAANNSDILRKPQIKPLGQNRKLVRSISRRQFEGSPLFM